MSAPTQPAPVAEQVQQLTHYRAVLEAAVASVPQELRDQRPDPGRWSVAEVLEHLAVLEGGIVQLLRSQAAAGPAEAAAASTLDERAVLDRSRPWVAPPRVQPRGELSAAAAWERLGQTRAALLAAMEGGDEQSLTQKTYPHPVLGPLSLRQWVTFIGLHEGRHAAQIEEIGQALSKN